MKKSFFLFSFLCVITIPLLNAQYTLIYTDPNASFDKGKELYFQRKYTASYHYFEDFLKTAKPQQAGQMHEAEYFLAANAFELRQKNAMELLNNFLLKYPYTSYADPVYAMIGMLYYEQKNYSEAIIYFEKVKENNLNPDKRIDFLFCKGYAYLENKEYKKASDIFKDLKSVESPQKISAIYYYAYSQYLLGNYEEALPEFLKIKNETDYQAIVPYYLVQIYYIQKDYKLARQEAFSLLENYPDNKNNAEIYRILGEIAYNEKNYKDAVFYLTKYEKMFPQVLRNDMYILGLSYFQLKDYKNAVVYLSKVTTTRDEISENAYLYLGSSYIYLNDKINARLAYEAALETNFNPAVREEALFNYALTCYETPSAFGETISAFTRFLSEFPNSKYSDEAYRYLAEAYLTTKNYELAYQSISQIKQLMPQLSETKQYLLYKLGSQAFVQNDYEKAIDYFTRALEISSSNKYAAECLFWRAECFSRLQKSAQAQNDLTAFFKNAYAKSSVNFIMANYSMAYAYFSQKKYSEALNWFLKYINLESNSSSVTYVDALNRIGDCYYNARNFEQALKYYDKVVQLSPETADYALFQSAYIEGIKKNYTAKISKLEKLLTLYPGSEYNDNALYEIARSYLMLNNNEKAIAIYQRLINQFPNSVLARKSMLEIGMIYLNEKNYDKAITTFKNVIEKYPESEEFYTALESLETIYVEINDVNAYLNYAASLGQKIKNVAEQREDSISYIAAEKQYLNGKYEVALTGLSSYVNKFCPGGRHCIIARYYLADCYYQTGEKEKALSTYQALLELPVSEFTEEAALRCAEITYDKKDYSSALNYFKKLETVAQSTINKNAARLGILRCNYFLNDYQSLVNIASEIIADPRSDESLLIESLYYRAKSYLELGKNEQAIVDLEKLSVDTRTTWGAESKYLLANVYFEQGKLKEAENEIMDFMKKNTPHQFWLAKSIVLLADIYVKKGDDFQAKQYLLSLRKNYLNHDEIENLIEERLQAIAKREKQKIIG
ncbi:MAG TPA: tetratricopeptide repeat protein [Paludibacteraceae bacterium]|nr:tetratricopeptide repeat protein [Paludibacteraceae bacterium]